jgi:NADH-quinone oxidoreductase subunit H
LRVEGHHIDSVVDVIAGVVFAIALLAVFWVMSRAKRRRAVEANAEPDLSAPFDPMAGGFPVPPLTGQSRPGQASQGRTGSALPTAPRTEPTPASQPVPMKESSDA